MPRLSLQLVQHGSCPIVLPHWFLVNRLPSIVVGLADTKSPSSSTHRPARDDEGLLLEDVNATIGAADLVIRLPEFRPLSPRPLQDGFGGMDTQSYEHTTEGDSTSQPRPGTNASSQAPALHQRATWPTPKPSGWQDIELVAERACMSLHWALSLRSVHHIPSETVHRLIAILCQLIQHLVAGHLPDLDLDMHKLFKSGLHPILTAQLKGQLADTELVVAMMTRMAIDPDLIPDSPTAA